MKLSNFSRKNLLLLIEMDKRKIITSSSQDIYGGLGFFGASKFLEKQGLIQNNGVGKDRKIKWTLTLKGKKFVSLIKDAEILLGGEI